MNKIVDKFGNFISNTYDKDPKRTLKLLKTAYSSFELKLRLENPLDINISAANYGFKTSTNRLIKALNNPDEYALVNIFFPCEILHAIDVEPLFIEGISGYINATAAERGFIDFVEDYEVPKSLCSYHKIGLGMAYSNVLPPAKAVMNSSMVCDANQLTFKYISDYWNRPYFMIDVPTDEMSEENINYVKNQIVDLAKEIEHVYGRKIDEDRLREIIKSENRAMKYYREYLKILPTKDFNRTLGMEMSMLFMTNILRGTDDSENYFKLLLDDIKNAPVKSGKYKKILWVHVAPAWETSISQFFENDERLKLLAMDINMAFVMDELDEKDPYLAIAQRIMRHRLRTGIDGRNEFVLEKAKDLDVDGIIYFNHWGCKLTLGGSQIGKKMFEENGFPTLVIDGDGSDKTNENSGQILTKMEAFVEMLGDKDDTLCL